MKWSPSTGEAADELREQAASCRRLALGARTESGSAALRTVACQFDTDAERIDPLPVTSDGTASGDSASLVRLRLALESQMRNRFGMGIR